MEQDTLVLLETFSTDAEAHIVAGMLESNGIPCCIDNQIFGSSVYPIGFSSLGGIRVMVLSRDLDRARSLLAQSHD